MPTVQTTETLRYFGRCPEKGCRHRRVVEAGSHPQVVQAGRTLVLAADNAPFGEWPLHELGQRDQYDAMREAGFTCPTHGRVVWFKGGRFTYNPEKVCNGTCMGATGHVCDCSCGGANHGRNRL